MITVKVEDGELFTLPKKTEKYVKLTDVQKMWINAPVKFESNPHDIYFGTYWRKIEAEDIVNLPTIEIEEPEKI